MYQSNKQTTRIFKAFCDENRLQILALLRGGEKCACDLLEELNIGQSTLSHHMRILCDSGVVVGRKEGKWVYYRIDHAGSDQAITLLSQLTTCNPKGRSNDPCCPRRTAG